MGSTCTGSTIKQNETILAYYKDTEKLNCGALIHPASGKPLLSVPNLFRMQKRHRTDSQLGLSCLDNSRNMGFLNATLQCLSNCQPFCDYFVSGYYKDDNLDRNRQRARPVTGLIAEFLKAQWTQCVELIEPKDLIDVLHATNPEIYEHEDPHETLLSLLDHIHFEMGRPGIEESPEYVCADSGQIEASAAWEKYLKQNESIVTDLFTGQLVSAVKCMHCSALSATYEPFNSLSLPLPHKGQTTLKACLNAFSHVNEINQSEVCKNCKQETRALKQVTLQKLPPILILKLRRFGWLGSTRIKKSSSVSYELSNFNMDQWVKPGGRKPYNLIGVICHQGHPESRKYTAICLNKLQYKWVTFDDEQMHYIDFDGINSKDAYVFFYQRSNCEKFYEQARDVPLSWGFPLQKPTGTHSTTMSLFIPSSSSAIDQSDPSGSSRPRRFSQETMAQIVPPSFSFDES